MPSALVSSAARLLAGLMLLASLGACTGDAPESSSPSTPQAASSTTGAVGGAMSSADDTPVPDVTLETLDGASIALNEQDGNVLLINFWATWCAPCREEIPDLVDLQNELGEKGLTVIGVSLDREGASVVKPFADKHGINYPIVLDPDAELESELGPLQALPTTLVVNTDGTITRRIIGLFPTDEMRPKLEAMLERSET